VLDPRGRVVVEVAPPGVPLSSVWAVLECHDSRSRPFKWAVVGVDDVAWLAQQAGFRTVTCHESEERWCAVLEESS
jgi:hypothetical protein